MTATEMTVTNGTCAYCQHDGDVIHPGSTLYQCADGKACMTRMDAINKAGRPGSGLTRAEDAYAHLASFQAGDVVDVAGEEFFMPGTITQAQRPDGDDITAAYLLVGGCGTQTRISVASLLDGMTVTLQNEVARGNVRYFDEAGYAAQNG